mgnify:CR=1 FL=1
MTNPASRSASVTSGTEGADYAWIGRLMYDWKDMFHIEASYAMTENAGGDAYPGEHGGARLITSHDYRLWTAGVDFNYRNWNLAGEYLKGSNLFGTGDRDQTTWWAQIGYRYKMWKPWVRHYSTESVGVVGTAFLTDENTDLGNTHIGITAYLDRNNDHNNNLKLAYVIASGDKNEWNGQGGYNADVGILQWQMAF